MTIGATHIEEMRGCLGHLRANLPYYHDNKDKMMQEIDVFKQASLWLQAIQDMYAENPNLPWAFLTFYLNNQGHLNIGAFRENDFRSVNVLFQFRGDRQAPWLAVDVGRVIMVLPEDPNDQQYGVRMIWRDLLKIEGV